MGGILEAFLSGKEARRVADAAEQINAMQSFIGQNGQAIMAGDQNALGQLAGFGVQGMNMAMGIQGNVEAREDRAYNRNRDKVVDARADQEFQLKLDAHRKNLSDEEAAKEAAAYANAATIAASAQTPEDWDRLATENGAPELVGQFGKKDEIVWKLKTASERLAALEPPSKMDALQLEEQRLKVEGLRNPDPADRYKVVDNRLVDMAAPGGPAAVDIGGAPPKVDFKDVADLRKEWIGMPAIKAFQTQSDALGRIVASATDPTAAGDMALLYGYMKLLDPGSVVRETEFETAAASGSLPTQIQGYATKLLNGQRLTAEQRADFLARAAALYTNAEAEYDNLRGQYTVIADRNGFSVDEALPDFRYSGTRGVGPSSPPPAVVPPTSAPAASSAPGQLSPEAQKWLDE